MDKDFQEQINELRQQMLSQRNHVIELENSIEDLFYSLISSRLRKPIIEEIVEQACLEYFSVSRKDFMGKTFVKEGNPINIDQPSRNIIESRKWFMSIMRNVLLKGDQSLILKSYPFYRRSEVHKHKPVYESGLRSEGKNRNILLGISAIVKRICKAEGVLSEDFEFL